MSSFRIYVNDARISTCVPLKDGQYFQVFPTKKVFANRGAWVGEWANTYDSLRIETQYPKEEDDYETESGAESTSISEEEETEYETEYESEEEDEEESESEEESEEETLVEWQPNSYKTNNTALDWLRERMWAKGIPVQVPAKEHHKCKRC